MPRPADGAPETVTEADPAAAFEDMEVDAPRVGILMGSKSDMAAMEPAERELSERGIGHEVRVMSAHRDPDVVADYARNAKLRGLRVIIAGAGLSAALPGRRRGAHVAARDRRPADLRQVGRGRPRRAAVDRPDAARRPGRVRGGRRGTQRRSARRAHPRQ